MPFLREEVRFAAGNGRGHSAPDPNRDVHVAAAVPEKHAVCPHVGEAKPPRMRLDHGVPGRASAALAEGFQDGSGVRQAHF